MPGLISRLRRRRPLGRVAFNMRPQRGPWGGSSPFVTQLAAYLRGRGYETGYSLEGVVDVIVLIDPRPDLQNKAFGLGEIAAYRARHPQARVLHRINECDQRKGTDFMDRALAEASRVADYSVFIAAWLRDYHAARWFDGRRAHCVIYNGADPRVFHPLGAAAWTGSGPFRLVTHHWSANPLKGFDAYAELDARIAEGTLPDTELWVIGRWPAEIRWRAARTFAPTSGRDLADKLRACHAYVTASRWEPCGMHHVEGAQCGLPLIYHRDGGGIVEAGEKYGAAFGDGTLPEAVATVRGNYEQLRGRVLERMPCGDRMVMEYTRVIQGLIATARA